MGRAKNSVTFTEMSCKIDAGNRATSFAYFWGYCSEPSIASHQAVHTYGAIAQNPLLRLTKLCIIMGLLLRALYCVSPSCAYLWGYCSEPSIASHQAVHTYRVRRLNPAQINKGYKTIWTLQF